jgi:hypothetical protein
LSNHVTFDTDTTYNNGKGTLTWNQNSDTLQLDLGNGVELELGQELFFQVRNNTGSQIDKGTAVEFTGALGNSGRITVGPSLASPSTPTEYFVGISAEDIPNNSDGRITSFGKIRGIDTRGGAENWQDGDLLYVSGSSAGSLTKVKPSSPTPDILAATVVNSSPNGIILVRPVYPFPINELTDVLITNPQDGDVLTYSASQQLWINQAPG